MSVIFIFSKWKLYYQSVCWY